MEHSQLIQMAQNLGYSSITNDGLCKGFSGMLNQAISAGDLASFEDCMSLLEDYASSPQSLAADVADVTEKIKNKELLSPKEESLAEIPAFFEGIALYLKPEIGYEVFNNKELSQTHEIEISPYIQ